MACSCHVVVAEESIREGREPFALWCRSIENRFHIRHTTVQLEVEGCNPNELFCGGAQPRARAGVGGTSARSAHLAQLACLASNQRSPRSGPAGFPVCCAPMP